MQSVVRAIPVALPSSFHRLTLRDPTRLDSQCVMRVCVSCNSRQLFPGGNLQELGVNEGQIQARFLYSGQLI